MKIVHISDLHFGKHHDGLRQNFLLRMKDMKPDAIVCTGDVSDQPVPELAEAAKTFLLDAAEFCLAPREDRLIVVPGNHDYRDWGFLSKVSKPPYSRQFSGMKTECFLKSPEGNVWIFGFDSASDGSVGGSGRVQDKELLRFEACYKKRQEEEGDAFIHALKIAAVHHHPLPVNRDDDKRGRFLTLTNSGQFLTKLLFKKVDVVLHGHEHLQAQSGFWSSLGDNRHTITVLSLGATLRQVQAPVLNWFGVITNSESGARADFYHSVGDTWAEIPEGEAAIIRSGDSLHQMEWTARCKSAGCFYREVASITVLGEDGDARRIVECEDLEVLTSGSLRAKEHKIQLPPTSGYLDCLSAKGKNFGIGVRPPIHRYARVKSWDATLEFEKKIVKQASYSYQWQAINAFAMDKRQFRYQYDNAPASLNNIEYTHFVVKDPIEELSVIVEFPSDFRPAAPPRLRVTRVDPGSQSSRGWESESVIEQELQEAHALRYYESMNVAALRVRRPRPDCGYGIEWEVPDVPRQPEGHHQPDVVGYVLGELQERRIDASGLLRAMARILFAARETVLREPDGDLWHGPVDASLMSFDGKSLPIVAMVRHHKPEDKQVTELRLNTSLRYGEGIAGRAFKANRPRVYVAAQPGVVTEEPDFYSLMTEAPRHTVLLSIPVYLPETDSDFRRKPRIYESRNPYGVFNLGSERRDCPLSSLLDDERDSQILQFQHRVVTMVTEALRALRK